MLLLVPCAANAQRADCPIRNVPMPMSPPGKPPEFAPNVSFPKEFGGEVKVEGPQRNMPMPETPPRVPPDLNSTRGPATARNEDASLMDVEEGHVTAVARLGELASSSPPQAVLQKFVDPSKTALANWRLVGFVPDPSSQSLTRVFSRDNSTLVFEQRNFGADGAKNFRTRSPNTKVGGLPALSGGRRAPSGCVAAILYWYSQETDYKLQIVGPLSFSEQRDVLMEVASSIQIVVGGN